MGFGGGFFRFFGNVFQCSGGGFLFPVSGRRPKIHSVAGQRGLKTRLSEVLKSLTMTPLTSTQQMSTVIFGLGGSSWGRFNFQTQVVSPSSFTARVFCHCPRKKGMRSALEADERVRGAPPRLLCSFFVAPPPPICRNVSDDFCCIKFGGFLRGFSWRGFFWALFPTKMSRKSPARKSAKKIRRPKNKNPQKIRSAKTPTHTFALFCALLRSVALSLHRAAFRTTAFGREVLNGVGADGVGVKFPIFSVIAVVCPCSRRIGEKRKKRRESKEKRRKTKKKAKKAEKKKIPPTPSTPTP